MMGMVATVAVGLFVLDVMTQVIADGRTDLKAVFLVVDAETDRPIEGATIHFRNFPCGTCTDYLPLCNVSLTTDGRGLISRGWTRCWTTTKGGLWSNTFSFYIPPGVFEASAPGYVTSRRDHLDSDEHRLSAKGTYPLCTLNVKIRLLKSSSVPTGSAEKIQP
jgi:hypothetical protein